MRVTSLFVSGSDLAVCQIKTSTVCFSFSVQRVRAFSTALFLALPLEIKMQNI